MHMTIYIHTFIHIDIHYFYTHINIHMHTFVYIATSQQSACIAHRNTLQHTNSRLHQEPARCILSYTHSWVIGTSPINSELHYESAVTSQS